MCRLAAYLGKPVYLERFLLAPEHNLIHQAWSPREMRSAALNADGFGFGWYDDTGCPVAYRNIQPAWADPNLAALGHTLRRELWLANVRSATEGFASGYANTQPFTDGRLLFLHNGFVNEFAEDLRPRLRGWLQSDIEATIHGNTDSEYLFAVIRQLAAEGPQSPSLLLRRLMDTLGSWVSAGRALLNIALTDGTEIAATRHAIGAECPTLYATDSEPLYSQGAVIASEPLTAGAHWEAVPAHHLVTLNGARPPRITAL
ncbi:ergothioneine biosynthesis protein EgtC [Nitrococcus mobilis]|uniref:ergothioneine biosynthesis protein EgtC n=1 Tax=Nitrococcus mobilis TaxID=35797 RepID=UPI0002F6B0AB|nr:ergothioneine biosynthesis protein EgtC [Nitrococcus mobilis]